MFHFESIISQLNETNDKLRKVQDAPTKFKSWHDYQSSLSPWILGIDDDFITDKFNTFGVKCKNNIDLIMSLILQGPNFDPKAEMNPNFTEEIQKDAFDVFMQIHQRYVTTPQGIQSIKRKYESGCFGQCPRVNCEGQHLLPMGFSYVPGESKVCGWCPKCMDSYDVNCDIDGAFYGPSFPHFFLQMTRDSTKFKTPTKTPLSYFGIPIETLN